MAKAKEIGRLFGVEIDGDRKNLFGSAANAKELEAVAIAQGHKAVIFEHSDAEIGAYLAEAAEDRFFDLGMQYYIAARLSAVLVGLMPVCGNLYHHAVEMFLKAGLSRKYSMRDLANRNKFGHCLPKIWEAFTADFASPALRQFDTVITNLQKWDEIRYPDKVLREGAAMSVEWVEKTSHTSPSSPPRYEVNGTAIDNFVKTIFEVLQKLPGRYTSRVNSNPDLRELLTRYHTEAEQIWGANSPPSER
jgi:hypothetical protein